MKKLLCVLLIVAVLLSFSACAQGSKATIYIPETVTVYGPNEDQYTSFSYVFEEGWQTKESFTVTYGGNTGVLGQNLPVMTYSKNCSVTELPNVSRMEMRYDDSGRLISQITDYPAASNMDKMEAAYTYDSNGRLLTEKITYFFPSGEPDVQEWIYTYTDTEHGSEGKSTGAGTTKIRVYDQNYRLVSQTDMIDGGELNRSENEYDAHGNKVLTAAYAEGKLITKTETKYKAVEVSSDFAARFPQFK